jgi:hypothetical protein
LALPASADVTIGGMPFTNVGNWTLSTTAR